MNLDKLVNFIVKGFFDYFENKGVYPDTVYLRPEHFELLPNKENAMVIGLRIFGSEYVPGNEMIFSEMNKCLVDVSPSFEFNGDEVQAIKYTSLPPFNIYKI